MLVNPVRGQTTYRVRAIWAHYSTHYRAIKVLLTRKLMQNLRKLGAYRLFQAKPGVPLSEVPEAIMEDKIKAFYIMGEDTLQTEPDINAVKKAFEKK